MRALAVAALLALLLVPRAAAERSFAAPASDRRRAAHPAPDREVGDGDLPRRAQGRLVARAVSREGPRHRRDLRQEVVGLGREGLVGKGRRDRRRPRRRRQRIRPRGLDRPQVAWKMARGYSGAFGGTVINNTWVWLGFCAVFFLGLADLRRPLSWRNLDLLALLFFSVSLGTSTRATSSRAFRSPIRRCSTCRAPRLDRRARAVARSLDGAAAGLGRSPGRRCSCSASGWDEPDAATVIDVGYAGVIGADRIARGNSLRDMPVEDARSRAARRLDGVRERIQTDGRCESANERGDTYRPSPTRPTCRGCGLRLEREVGQPARRARDLDHLGRPLPDRARARRLRFGGTRLSATLSFAWAAYPFTAYVLASNTNDAIMPAFLIWGFWLASSPWARGAFSALAGGRSSPRF